MPSTNYRGLSFSPSCHRWATELSCSKARFPERNYAPTWWRCANCLVVRNTQLFSSEKQTVYLSSGMKIWQNLFEINWNQLDINRGVTAINGPQTWVSLSCFPLRSGVMGPKHVWPKALYPQAHHPNHHPESTKQQQPDSSWKVCAVSEKLMKHDSGWWLQPLWKILVKMGIFPKKGWKQKIFETTTQEEDSFL